MQANVAQTVGHFTDQLAACIRKRSKAIKHRGRKITSDRIKEVRNGVDAAMRQIEATLDASFEAQPTLRIEEIWNGTLARGPHPV